MIAVNFLEGWKMTYSSKMTIKTKNNMITVFYDGKCGLCSKEINHYRKVAPSGIFSWQDITESARLRIVYITTLLAGVLKDWNIAS